MVVFFSVLPAKDFCLQKTGKKLHIEELIPEACVKALAVGVLPRSARFDVESLHSPFCDPLLDRIGAMNSGPLSLRMNSGAPRSSTSFSNVSKTSLAVIERSTSKERHSRVFIHNGKPLEAATSLGLIEDEVVAPDMIDPLGSLPLRPIGTLPKPSALAGAWRHLQPFLLPEPMNSLLVHDPSLSPQIAEDTPVSRTGFPCGNPMHRAHQGGIPFHPSRLVALAAPWLSKAFAGPALAEG